MRWYVDAELNALERRFASAAEERGLVEEVLDEGDDEDRDIAGSLAASKRTGAYCGMILPGSAAESGVLEPEDVRALASSCAFAVEGWVMRMSAATK